MIFDGIKPKFGEVVKSAESTAAIHCKHDEDFWKQAETMEFGDVCLCYRCNQYFTKIKTMPRIVREKTIFHFTPNGKIKVKMKPVADHWDRVCIVKVPVRLTDDKETNKED